MRLPFLLSIAVLGTPASWVAAQATLDARVDRYFSAPVAAGEFSGVVLVARGDSVLLRRAYGSANVELGVPLTTSHRFMIASVTKTFTGAVVAMLAQQGKLGLQDSLARFLPEFPASSRIRIEQLLLHSSGVPNPDYESIYGKHFSLPEVIRAIAARPLQFEPGSRGAYSNAGYNLLAAVIERAAGIPYPRVLADQLFAPLGMTNTGDAADGAAVMGLATPHIAGPGPMRARPVAANPSQAPGSGSVYSTVDDLFRWARALQLGRPVDPRALRYPYGWGRRERSGGVWLEQTGMIDGWTSNIYAGLDSAIVVVVLSNRQAPTFVRWGREIAGFLMGEEAEPLIADPPMTSDVAAADVAGEYEGQFTVRLTMVQGHLYGEVGGWALARYARPIGPDQFHIGDYGEVIRVERDAQRRVVAILWGQGASPLRLVRRAAD